MKYTVRALLSDAPNGSYLHMTLAYLGSSYEDKTDDIQSYLSQDIKQILPFTVTGKEVVNLGPQNNIPTLSVSIDDPHVEQRLKDFSVAFGELEDWMKGDESFKRSPKYHITIKSFGDFLKVGSTYSIQQVDIKPLGNHDPVFTVLNTNDSVLSLTELPSVEALTLEEEEEEKDEKKTEAKFDVLILNGRHYQVDYHGRVVQDGELAIGWVHDNYIDMLLNPKSTEYRNITDVPRWEGFWLEQGQPEPGVPVKMVSAAFSLDDARILNVHTDNEWVLSCQYHHKHQACTPVSYVPIAKQDAGTEISPEEAEKRAKAREKQRTLYPAKGFYSGEVAMYSGAASQEVLRQVRHQKHVHTCPMSDEASYTQFIYYMLNEKKEPENYIGKATCTCPRQLTGRQLELLRIMQQDTFAEQDPVFFGLQEPGWGITSTIAEYIVQKVFELQRQHLRKDRKVVKPGEKMKVIMLYLGSTPERCSWFFHLLRGLCIIQGLRIRTDKDEKELLVVDSNEVEIEVHVKPHSFITVHDPSEKFSFNTDWLFVDDLCDSVDQKNLFYFIMTHIYVAPLTAFVFGTSDDWEVRNRCEQKFLVARRSANINKFKRFEHEAEQRKGKGKKDRNRNNKKNKKKELY